MRTRAGSDRTIYVRRLTREQVRLGELAFPPADQERPRVRGDCEGGARPCPWVSCRHSLYLSVHSRTGSITLSRPGLAPHQLPPDESCALDVAERGGLSEAQVGRLLGLSRHSIWLIEQGLRRLLPRVRL